MSETGERGGIRQRIVDDYAGHKLYDERGGKFGKVEYTVLDAGGKPEYLAVKTGWFGSNTTLIPEEIARLGDRGDEFEIQASEDRIKDAPTFDNEDDVNRDFEDRVREHFGLGKSGGGSGSATGAAAGAAAGPSATSGEPRSETRGSDRESGYSDSEDRDRIESRSDYEDRDTRDRDDRRMSEADSHSAGDSRAESRGTRDRDDRDLREDRREPRDAAGAASGSISRDTDRGDDRRDERPDDRSAAGSRSGEREKVRVTVKRERARAERVIGEDGKEEVRIRKEMVEEEEMVEVEDRL